MYSVINFTRSCNTQLMQWCYFCCESLVYRQLPSRRKLPSDADIHSLLRKPPSFVLHSNWILRSAAGTCCKALKVFP
ncbi:hypothetical protein BAE44_0014214 [Dichanthelium oligosanthes]|uniref:Uncharacterized protein n=1 Tax=Dichanthelium oligosanthes TaxID=888268 RepID=A0A1E5VI20_9POAL|nr:hypothetical protein BAE44_0014214 [Dichanthelium oligosanthes]